MPGPGSSAPKPPPVMTWGKAAPVLVIAALFDAVRFMFQWFIFFGPALAAAYCTAQTSGSLETWTLGFLGVKTAAAVCATAAGAAGFFGAGIIGSFGMIMAMVTGLAGWSTVGLILLRFNARIFKENALWFGASLLVSQVPFIGSIPAISLATWRMYHHQIKLEKEAFKKYEKERGAAELQARQRARMRQQATDEQIARENVDVEDALRTYDASLAQPQGEL